MPPALGAGLDGESLARQVSFQIELNRTLGEDGRLQLTRRKPKHLRPYIAAITVNNPRVRVVRIVHECLVFRAFRLTMYYLGPYKMPIVSRSRIRSPWHPCQDWDLSPTGFLGDSPLNYINVVPGLITTAHVEQPP